MAYELNYDVPPSQQPYEAWLPIGPTRPVRYRWDRRIPEEQLFPVCARCGRWLSQAPDEALWVAETIWPDVSRVRATRHCAHCGQVDLREELKVDLVYWQRAREHEQAIAEELSRRLDALFAEHVPEEIPEGTTEMLLVVDENGRLVWKPADEWRPGPAPSASRARPGASAPPV